MASQRVSIPELIKAILDADGSLLELAPGGVVVGPANREQQVAGVIALAESGITSVEDYLPLMRAQMSARCIAASIEHVSRISAKLWEMIHMKGRQVVRQPSADMKFLVHFTRVNGGPTLTKGDTDDTWEDILTVEAMVGTEEVT